MSYTCNFCNAILASEYSLLKHQKTTKKCIIKQGLVISKGNFKCDMCDETFIFKSVLKSHIISCSKKNSEKIKISEENTLVKSKLLELETKYILLADKKELETKYNMLLGDKKDWKEKEEKLLDKITTAAFTKTNTVKNNINITTYTRTDEELKTIYADNLNSSHIE